MDRSVCRQLLSSKTLTVLVLKTTYQLESVTGAEMKGIKLLVLLSFEIPGPLLEQQNWETPSAVFRNGVYVAKIQELL